MEPKNEEEEEEEEEETLPRNETFVFCVLSMFADVCRRKT